MALSDFPRYYRLNHVFNTENIHSSPCACVERYGALAVADLPPGYRKK